MNKQKLREYLESIYASKESWAKCFTHQEFAAGLNLISPAFEFILGILSTQRNESTNHVLKMRLQHFQRTNIIRVIAIIGEMIDTQYHQVISYSHSS
ncbi:MAG: hypothetical protein EOO46_20815 [Flavobacterium sp.]|nr:MAG: hypothetical protein EOO46_20815 [Flavobacterium sp.]